MFSRDVLFVLLITVLSLFTCPVQAQQRDVVQEVDPVVEVDNMPMGHPRVPWQECYRDPNCYCGEEADCCPATYCPAARYRPRYVWARAEYLGWWKQGMKLPPLVTTNPTAAPALDDPNTVILFGNDTINNDGKSGGRFTLGMWADPCHRQGLEFTYMTLGTETTSYHASGDDYAILGRPFFNIKEAAADASLIDFTNPAYTGWVNVVAETKFQGTELLYRRAVMRCPYSRVDLLAGWRWLQLKDDLLISESATQVGVATIDLSDRFNTKNNFHGVEFGIQWEQPLSSYWTFEMLGKLAIGSTRSVVTIDGQQTSVPDQGLLALDSNSGTHACSSFSAITEIGLSIKRRFQCGIEASFGYTLVYWSEVMRAGDQIDLDVDPRQIPPNPQTATHPELLMNTTDFWAQGLHCGLEYVF